MSRSAALLRQPATGAAPAISSVLARAPIVQRSCAACGAGQSEEGKCPACEDPHALAAVQAKLTIGAPDDPLEKEADEVADKVMRMPAGGADRSIAARDDRDGATLRLQAAAPAAAPTPGFTAALGTATGGAPLPASARSFFEPRFGRDLGHVRIHDNASAGALARDITARAFTRGADIYFASGQYDSESKSGRRLLAHELTHVVQQGGSAGPVAGLLQRDLAVPPTKVGPKIAKLSAAQIAAAITYNSAKFTDLKEVALLRDILGLEPEPAIIDDAFIAALVDYQAGYGLTQDGRIGPKTREQLSREIIAEGSFLGNDNLGTLGPEFKVRDDIRTLIDAGTTTYADYKASILPGTLIQKNVALLHETLLTDLKGKLVWNNFARCVELLGREAPSVTQLINDPTVRAAVRRAWNDSNPAVNGPGTTEHEEGGWVYMNLITGAITTRRATRGAGASISLAAPPILADHVVVGEFHTHPNLGPGWIAGPSDGDTASDAADGLPDVIAGTTGIDPAQFDFFPSGPTRRLHLAGSQGLPGAAGGLAPQAKADRSYDEK